MGGRKGRATTIVIQRLISPIINVRVLVDQYPVRTLSIFEVFQEPVQHHSFQFEALRRSWIFPDKTDTGDRYEAFQNGRLLEQNY